MHCVTCRVSDYVFGFKLIDRWVMCLREKMFLMLIVKHEKVLVFRKDCLPRQFKIVPRLWVIHVQSSDGGKWRLWNLQMCGFLYVLICHVIKIIANPTIFQPSNENCSISKFIMYNLVRVSLWGQDVMFLCWQHHLINTSFQPSVKEQLSKLILFNVGKCVIHHSQKLQQEKKNITSSTMYTCKQ